MTMRPLFLAIALLAGCMPALAQSEQDAVKAPVLRAHVIVTSEVVRIGDLIDNAGAAAQIAVYRAPDLGTTGSLRTAQVLDTLRAHQIIGVDTHDVREVSVTRSARTLSAKDVQQQIAKVLEQRSGLGNAENLSVTFDRELGDLQLDASNSGDLRASMVRYDARNGRFDVMFEVANELSSAPTRLRFTGIVVETVEAAVLTRNVERGDVLKASDVVVERRPKAETGNEAILRSRALGMQARRSLRMGQAIKVSDLGKADLVTRDQSVTLIYEAPGIYLTGRGKALESGTEGDTVNILNLQSKRTVQAVVVGPGQAAVTAVTPRATITAALARNAMSADTSSAKTE